MRINPEQTVFPFLAEDPIYIEALRTERTVREVLSRLKPEIQTIVGDMIQGQLEEYVGELIGGKKVSAPRTTKTALQTRFFSHVSFVFCRSGGRNLLDCNPRESPPRWGNPRLILPDSMSARAAGLLKWDSWR